jgi:hypothetical protein
VAHEYINTPWGAFMSDDYYTTVPALAPMLRQPQAPAPAPRPAPANVPSSPVAEATHLLAHTLHLTEALALALQARLAPVLQGGSVVVPDWRPPAPAPDPCPLTVQLGDATAHLLAITMTLHTLVERLAL